MKFLLIVAILAAAYFILAKRNSSQHQPATSPSSAEVAAAAASPAPAQGQGAGQPGSSSNYLKRPLDRTHEVLDQASKKKASEAF